MLPGQAGRGRGQCDKAVKTLTVGPGSQAQSLERTTLAEGPWTDPAPKSLESALNGASGGTLLL